MHLSTSCHLHFARDTKSYVLFQSFLKQNIETQLQVRGNFKKDTVLLLINFLEASQSTNGKSQSLTCQSRACFIDLNVVNIDRSQPPGVKQFEKYGDTNSCRSKLAVTSNKCSLKHHFVLNGTCLKQTFKYVGVTILKIKICQLSALQLKQVVELNQNLIWKTYF